MGDFSEALWPQQASPLSREESWWQRQTCLLLSVPVQGPAGLGLTLASTSKYAHKRCMSPSFREVSPRKGSTGRWARVALLWPVRTPERGSCPAPLPGPLLQLEAFWGLRVASSSCLLPACGVDGVHSLGVPTLTQLQVCLSQFQLPLLFPPDARGQLVPCPAVRCSRKPCPVIL